MLKNDKKKSCKNIVNLKNTISDILYKSQQNTYISQNFQKLLFNFRPLFTNTCQWGKKRLRAIAKKHELILFNFTHATIDPNVPTKARLSFVRAQNRMRSSNGLWNFAYQ